MMAMTTSSSIRVKAARDRTMNAFGAHQNSLGPLAIGRRLGSVTSLTCSEYTIRFTLVIGLARFPFTNLDIRNAAADQTRADEHDHSTIVRDFRRQG